MARHIAAQKTDAPRRTPDLSTRIVRVPQGGYNVSSDRDVMLTTTLGSCVAVCIRDPVILCGGMNHFVLPANQNEKFDVHSLAMRYGCYSIERLINHLIARGGMRERLEIKVFGGGNMFQSQSRIGDKNADFVESYLEAEALPIVQWPKTDDGRNFVAHHVKPLADGGPDTLDNIVPMHPDLHIPYHVNNGDFSRWRKRRNP